MKQSSLLVLTRVISVSVRTFQATLVLNNEIMLPHSYYPYHGGDQQAHTRCCNSCTEPIYEPLLPNSHVRKNVAPGVFFSTTDIPIHDTGFCVNCYLLLYKRQSKTAMNEYFVMWQSSEKVCQKTNEI